jgi:outer membrane protein OmpA-like peptidoglycan-associated protein
MGLFSLEHRKAAYWADFVLYGVLSVLMAAALLWLSPVSQRWWLLGSVGLGLAAWTPLEYLLHRLPPALQPVVKQRVSFSAESLFGFDKDTVQPEGKAALDGFSQKMTGTQFDMVSVEGHTDRLGSAAYNDKLSLRRAESVKAYLVTSGGLDAMKVNATGKGEGSPTTQPSDCKGNSASTALIACLQPDRRVDIEVSGSR